MNYVVKIGLVGDYAVGKSSLMNTFVKGEEQSRNDTTIGVDFNHKILKYEDYTFKLHMWDTAGQEKFRSIVKSYYRDLNVVLFVYDKTNPESFKNLEQWLLEVDTLNKNKKVKIVIGNKKDLDKDNVIPIKNIIKFSKENKLIHMETSVKDQKSVDLVFSKLVKILHQKILSQEIELKTYIPFDELNVDENKKNKNSNKKNIESKCCIIS